MGKLKTLFSNMSTSIKETFKKYPITMIIVYITTFIFTFGTDDFIDKFCDELWFMLMVAWAIGTLFTETFFKKELPKIIGGFVSLGIAFLVRHVLNFDEPTESLLIERIVLTYLFVAPLFTVYKIIKDSELSVKEYALNVLSNVGKASTIYALANLGVLVVILVFIELILDGHDYDILTRTLILLLGAYYVPSLVNALTEVKEKAGKFIRVLLTCVLMPVAIFLIAILYLYVAKIMISGELLNKSLFFILSLTFSLAIPCVILLKNYEDNKKVLVLSNIIFYSFIPLMFLQILAMNVRVQDYGLTESRYMGYLLIVFEIIFIALMIIKKAKYVDKIILVLVGLIVWGLLTPFNVYSVPVYSQTARITDMLKDAGSFEALTTEQKNECKRALVYIERSLLPEYINKKIAFEVKEQIENYEIVFENTGNIINREYEYVSMWDSTISGLNIEGYSKLYQAYDTSYYGKDDVELSNYTIKDKKGEVQVTVNMKDFAKEMARAERENHKESTFEKLRYMKTNNENIIFCVTEFSLSYELYSNKIEHFSVNGFLLVK